MFNKLKNMYVTLATIGAAISFIYSIFLLIKWAYIKTHSTKNENANLPKDEKIPQKEEEPILNQSPIYEKMKENGLAFD